METITINTIQKQAHKSPYFFDTDWMRLNHQSMNDFKVKKSTQGNIYIYAPSTWDNEFMGFTFHQFINNDLVSVKGKFMTELEVLNYINTH